MRNFEEVQSELHASSRKWLVTGCAGFIGSNLLEALLKLNQTVVGMDNLSTGYQHNLDDVRSVVRPEQWTRFHFIHGDIRDIQSCREAVSGIDTVLHQAALGSVPRSLDDPITTNSSNVNGFLNMLVASRDAGVRSFVYAASSSTYGDHPGLPKVEAHIGKPLSPYAVTKYVNELYAEVFARCYSFNTIGLRYFNVFGKRQDPDGAYAAVIPKWINAMISGNQVNINGDGTTSRDFCYIANAIQANLLAATISDKKSAEIYNVAVSDITTLNQLFEYLRCILNYNGISVMQGPAHHGFRRGDVLHSKADIGKAVRELGYAPEYRIYEGLEATIPWYVRQIRNNNAPSPY